MFRFASVVTRIGRVAISDVASRVAAVRRAGAPVVFMLQPATRAFSVRSASLSDRLRSLRSAADTNPLDAHRQLEYLRELRAVDPAEVINRVESKRFAVDAQVFDEYTAALKAVGRLENVTVRQLLQIAADSNFNAAREASSPARTHSAPPDDDERERVRPPVPSRAPSLFELAAGAGAGEGAPGTQSNPVYVAVSGGPSNPIWNMLKWTVGLGIGLWLLQAYLEMDRKNDKAMGGVLKTIMRGSEPVPVMGSDKRFSDVRGCDEAKAELVEIVEFLKDPKKFTRLGGKLPRGVLLTGNPGTGKTLLARAVAGEAGVPFFYASGSEFEEMFVGVGARRIRDLFAAAKAHAPCIVFIDEIDAIGSTRNPRDMQYIKMTLNQLLVEMDGFKPSDGVIVIAATNFPEVLDKALTRPGRFDRHVNVPPPDVEGRRQILELYAGPIPLDKDVDLRVLARGTPGFTGAELANLVSMAAIQAAIENRDRVSMKDFEFAKDKIIMGAERKSAVISPETRQLTAYHEGGHAIAALFTQHAHPVHKATIMPRGHALGMVTQLPDKDDPFVTRAQLLARLDVCMGGRVAEEMIFGEQNVTTGASSDFQQATAIATRMVTEFGMSAKIGPLVMDKGDRELHSPEMKDRIDSEVKALLDASYERVKLLLRARSKELHALARALLEHETLTGEEVKRVVRGESLPSRHIA